MMEQERLLGRNAPRTVQGVVPEQRGPADQPAQAGVAYAGVPYRAEPPQGGGGPAPGARLRVDARRNLESVLRAAREVFGEFGYGAPMEEVARRAGVGVGTVYRRFPSKEVLVQRIAAEEVAWLTTQARESLYGGDGAWESLAGYLARAVSTGAGRLLPPEAFRYAEELGRVPGQRAGDPAGAGTFPGGRFEPRVAGVRAGGAPQAGDEPVAADADPRLLLQLLAALVARAGAAGELRPGVTVADVVLVLTASVPVHAARGAVVEPVHASAAAAAVGQFPGGDGGPTDGQQPAGPGDRLLQILLDGLRAR
ncbi:helix-turn-helix domain-containing protein [Kitasatospora sp. NBC_01560]|uniref:TetR/AcrR family transcriptional regulator n=1 Tax=Kitasatospora sp. NBC_01560 TaxID=2975965 RepID=UPI00386F4751